MTAAAGSRKQKFEGFQVNFPQHERWLRKFVVAAVEREGVSGSKFFRNLFCRCYADEFPELKAKLEHLRATQEEE